MDEEVKRPVAEVGEVRRVRNWLQVVKASLEEPVLAQKAEQVVVVHVQAEEVAAGEEEPSFSNRLRVVEEEEEEAREVLEEPPS